MHYVVRKCEQINLQILDLFKNSPALDLTNKFGYSPLWLAAYEGKSEIIDWFQSQPKRNQAEDEVQIQSAQVLGTSFLSFSWDHKFTQEVLKICYFNSNPNKLHQAFYFMCVAHAFMVPHLRSKSPT